MKRKIICPRCKRRRKAKKLDYCRECHKDLCRVWREKNPEKFKKMIKASVKKYLSNPKNRKKFNKAVRESQIRRDERFFSLPKKTQLKMMNDFMIKGLRDNIQAGAPKEQGKEN